MANSESLASTNYLIKHYIGIERFDRLHKKLGMTFRVGEIADLRLLSAHELRELGPERQLTFVMLLLAAGS